MRIESEGARCHFGVVSLLTYRILDAPLRLLLRYFDEEIWEQAMGDYQAWSRGESSTEDTQVKSALA